MKEKLRFAPLIRVSTEQQEQQGQSLEVQKAKIVNAVKALNGVIPKVCKEKYSGQEHATAGFEREKFKQLL